MAISQMALIQSLGEAMAWLEREVEWGVPATELRHLCGRIGELFVAVTTNGRMATEVNQKGYDVVSSTSERISVKTTATIGSASHLSFNSKTLAHVDRIIVLRINTEEREIATLMDMPIAEAIKILGPDVAGKRVLALSKLVKKASCAPTAKAVVEASIGSYTIRELENGAIQVERDGRLVEPAKPALRDLAGQLFLGLLNGNGNPYNTRQLGSLVIKAIQEQERSWKA